jgi:hypothetical protein
MTVFVLDTGDGYNPGCVLGVYSTLERAQQAYADDRTNCWIRAYELDANNATNSWYWDDEWDTWVEVKDADFPVINYDPVTGVVRK